MLGKKSNSPASNNLGLSASPPISSNAGQWISIPKSRRKSASSRESFNARPRAAAAAATSANSSVTSSFSLAARSFGTPHNSLSNSQPRNLHPHHMHSTTSVLNALMHRCNSLSGLASDGEDEEDGEVLTTTSPHVMEGEDVENDDDDEKNMIDGHAQLEEHVFWSEGMPVFSCPFPECAATTSAVNYAQASSSSCLDGPFEMDLIMSLQSSIAETRAALSAIDEPNSSFKSTPTAFTNDFSPPFSNSVTRDPMVALVHLRHAHGIAVLNPHAILPYFHSYIKYWVVERIKPLSTGCSSKGRSAALDTVRWDPSRMMTSQEAPLTSSSSCPQNQPIFVLGMDGCTEDAELRERLRKDKLNEMLTVQERERQTPSTPRKCLFCKTIPTSKTSTSASALSSDRHALFSHMFSEHGFHIGLPDNLVHVDTYLDLLQVKLECKQCLYCEKTFKSQIVLRKHMRKKKHFRINPRNHVWDRFYLVNYVDPARLFRNHDEDEEEEDLEDGVVGGASTATATSTAFGDVMADKDGWDDWDEPALREPTMCLFDENVFPSASLAYAHMKSNHGFDLTAVRKKLRLNFYQTIRLINYIRRQTSLARCFACGLELVDVQGLVDHLQSSGHVNAVSPPPPPRTSTDDTNAVSAMSDFWNDPQYLFPTYENDPLLFDAGDDTLFDRADLHEDDNDMDGFHVIPESKIMLKNIEK